jgi:hypothetical protein
MYAYLMHIIFHVSSFDCSPGVASFPSIVPNMSRRLSSAAVPKSAQWFIRSFVQSTLQDDEVCCLKGLACLMKKSMMIADTYWDIDWHIALTGGQVEWRISILPLTQ